MRTRALILPFAVTLGLAGRAALERLPTDLLPIQRQRAGQVETFASRYAEDANQAYASFTAGNWGCSGALIGPNTYLTASHCGFNDTIDVTFETYRERDAFQPESITVTCEAMIQNLEAHPDKDIDITDIALYWCEDAILADGTAIAPGDLLGYLDVDLRHHDDVPGWYSAWWNDVADEGLPWSLLWSPGWDMELQNTAYWPYRLELNDMWGNAGASGSPVISEDNHRVFTLTSSASADTTWRGFYMSLDNALRYAKLAPNGTNGFDSIDDDNLAAMGLIPASYEGLIDDDGDELFDVQQDAEAAHDPGYLAHTWLGFESRRRNAIWDLGPRASLWPDHWTPPGPAYGILGFDGRSGVSAAETIASTDRVPLKAKTRYRVSVIYSVLWTKHAAGLGVMVTDGSGSSTTTSLSTATAGGIQREAIEITTSGDPREIALRALGGVHLSIYYVSIIEDGSLMDLDTDGRRQGWRDLTTGARALFLPDGTGKGLDWAVAVPPGPSTAWQVRNEHLALVPGKTYQICFQHRVDPAGGASTGSGKIRAISSATGATLKSKTFSSTAAWASACMDKFVAGTWTDLQFGSTGESYLLIDDVTITRL